MTHQAEKIMEKALAWIAVTVLTALISWATWSTAQTSKHETRLSVVETRANNIDKSLDKLERNSDEQTRMLQRLLARRH